MDDARGESTVEGSSGAGQSTPAAAIHLATGRLCYAAAAEEGVRIDKSSMSVMASLVENLVTDVLGKNLELFAQHAGRETVTADDVMLLVRLGGKDPGFADHLQQQLSRHRGVGGSCKETRVTSRSRGAIALATAATDTAIAHMGSGVTPLLLLPGNILACHVLPQLTGQDLGRMKMTAKAFLDAYIPSAQPQQQWQTTTTMIETVAELLVAERYGPEAKLHLIEGWSWARYLHKLERLPMPEWPCPYRYRTEPRLLHPRSKIGGLPDLAQAYPLLTIPAADPPDQQSAAAGSQVPFTFLCQVNLADLEPKQVSIQSNAQLEEEGWDSELLADPEEITPEEMISVRFRKGEKLLPEAGLLSIFYDTVRKPWAGGQDSCKVIYTPPGATLQPVPIPDLTATHQDLEYLPANLLAPEHLSAESPDPERMRRLRSGEERPHNARWHENEASDFLCGWNPRRHAREAGAPIIRLLGTPNLFQQDCLQYQAERMQRGQRDPFFRELTEIERSVANHQWILLLEVPSLESCGLWHWGNYFPGNIYFMVRRDHLAARDFSHVKVILQCG
jgi:histone H3/H4